MAQLQTEDSRTLALAGMFQAAELVDQLARHGQCDGDALAATLGSIFAIDADTAEDVYGGLPGIHLGLRVLQKRLGGAGDSGALDSARYVLGMIQLERRLRGNRAMTEALRQGILTVESQISFFSEGGVTHPSIVGKLAELYRQTISTLTPRIIVNGDHRFLADPATANKVRATLLGGIRSAFLWRQLKGSRLKLLFHRKRIIERAGELAARA